MPIARLPRANVRWRYTQHPYSPPSPVPVPPSLSRFPSPVSPLPFPLSLIQIAFFPVSPHSRRRRPARLPDGKVLGTGDFRVLRRERELDDGEEIRKAAGFFH